ncbi:MAG TPA: RpiB/LacA/LacB family sugar-phosphate isomerase [Ktedonobacterales bacterium]|nr:RpiB/LacA/LacB family sugar-phosphate isomerase [Ktedonobacterales bacterium]
MKIAIGSDERTHLTEVLVEELRRRGHEALLFGPLATDSAASDWPVVCGDVARAVASGQADEGIVCCWTGTGATIAANKVPRIRAALCHDAETARGARVWNHANVLALSLRATPEAVAREILDAWFSTPYSDDEWNLRQIERIRSLEDSAQSLRRTEIP